MYLGGVRYARRLSNGPFIKLGGQYVAKINSRYYYRVTGFELELGGGQLECNRFMELWADVDVILVSNLFMELCAETEVVR